MKSYRSNRALLSVLVSLLLVFIGRCNLASAVEWKREMILNPNPNTSDLFGYTLATLGENVLVSGYRDDAVALNSGAAYLFNVESGQLLMSLYCPTLLPQEYFGRHVAAAGDDMLIGSYRADFGATNAGAAYLFDGENGDLRQTFLNPDPDEDDYFGTALAGNHELVLIGARMDDTGATDSGAAYLFDKNSGQLLRTFLNPNPSENAFFGGTVAMFGDNVLVSSTGYSSGAGAVYMFSAATGELVRTINNPDPDLYEWFGSSICTLGDNIIIGTPNDNSLASNSGVAYLIDGTTGALLHTFQNPTPEEGDWFGTCVATVQGGVLIGAPNDTSLAGTTGAAYLFDPFTGELLDTLQAPYLTEGSDFGSAMTGVGSRMVIAAPRANAQGYTDTGLVYVFTPVPSPQQCWLWPSGNRPDFDRKTPTKTPLSSSCEPSPGGNACHMLFADGAVGTCPGVACIGALRHTRLPSLALKYRCAFSVLRSQSIGGWLPPALPAKSGVSLSGWLGYCRSRKFHRRWKRGDAIQ